MKTDSKLSLISSFISSDLVKRFNNEGLNPDDIISIVHSGEQYVLFYKKPTFVEIDIEEAEETQTDEETQNGEKD